MSMWKKIGLALLVLGAALVLKLIWFPPPFNKETALEAARWQLEKASEFRRFDLSKFGKPNYVSGNDKDGYLVYWNFQSANSETRLHVTVSVAPLDIDFTGTPFILDCRPEHDHETRQAGFGFLCKGKARSAHRV